MRAAGSLSRRRLHVHVVDGAGRRLPARGLARWLERLAPKRAAGTLTVAIVSDQASRSLNRSYRGIDHATDVLSFPSGPAPQHGARHTVQGPRHGARRTVAPEHGARLTAHGPGHPTNRTSRTAHLRTAARRTAHVAPHLGDVVIARGVARRQARSVGHAETTEWRVLALHGLLHLIGYDHEQDAGRMERVERRLRQVGGLDTGLIEREGHR